MKKILSSTLFAFAIAGALVSCNKDSGLTNPTMPMKAGTTTSANPAITYVGATSKKGYNYSTVAVMDTDGSHQTNLITGSSNTGSENYISPSWSPSGGSIAYIDKTIQAFDVSVNSSGVAVASNARTIYSPSASDSVTLKIAAWCSATSTAKIAFIRQAASTNHVGLSELCTISDGGGTVTVLASYQKQNSRGTVTSYFGCPTWSPDDSKIAVTREDTINQYTIMIFDASTGAALDSIPSISPNIGHLEWSRTGLNKLVYDHLVGSTSYLYYVTPTTGSTPATNSVVGNKPTWSPDNSSIMYTNSALMKVVSQSSTTSTVLSSPPSMQTLKWKR